MVACELPALPRGGHWDFRFCDFGYFLDRFFGFCCKRLRFFGFGGHCGLRIFPFFSIWFSVFVKNTSGFSVLLPDVVFGFSYFVLFWVPVSVRFEQHLISNSRETPKSFRGMRDKINVMVGYHSKKVKMSKLEYARSRGTQREYSSKPHKHSIVEHTLVFKRQIKAYFHPLKIFRLFGFPS